MQDQRPALQALSVKQQQQKTETLTLLSNIYQCIKPVHSLKAHIMYVCESN